MAPWSRKDKKKPEADDAKAAPAQPDKNLDPQSEKLNPQAAKSDGGNSSSNDEPLPAYSAEAPQQPTAAELAELTAVLDSLQLGLTAPAPRLGHDYPSADTCLAHLKFLFAVHALKEEVGYTDGIFGLPDSLAGSPDTEIPLNLPAKQPIPRTGQEVYRARLSKIREKRWALYVARAVDRYEAWWTAAVCPPNKSADRLEEADMLKPGSPKFNNFPLVAPEDAFVWTPDTLLPLDVWMVMHAHMLNPRAFLEDCIRYGARGIWAAGLPWERINAAIDNSQQCRYSVSDETMTSWVALTGRCWDNVEDPLEKQVTCPACYAVTAAPWTTCGATWASGDLLGAGYGDGGNGFGVACVGCGFVIDRKALAVGKFVSNSLELIRGDMPMPGTILDPKTGRPDLILQRTTKTVRPEGRTFPNRLIKRGGLLSAIVGGTGSGAVPPLASAPALAPLIDRNSLPRTTTMDNVRARIEAILSDSAKLKDIDEYYETSYVYRPQELARLSIRKMMSRYWDNASPFALDLTGAVLRQGIFIDKMHSLDWLHSPAARATMDRLLVKYARFVALLAANPTQVCVPTLDVDLAWHTHQLSPASYYRTSVRRVGGKFVDHDDKIDEDKLHLAFEFTCKAYQEKYGEVYSECTCWYCEAVRAAHVSSVGQRLGLSRQGEVVDNFHKSGASARCPAPDRAAHLSAHNAVLFVENSVRSRVTRQIRAAQLARLDSNYQKAMKRAAKSGRTLPPREQYYDHWGYQYYMYSPYMYPLYFNTGYYYASPGFVPMGVGEWANCAGGSCGSGGVAAGACGGPGGCGSCGSISGGCGGGGGGCGGGGGGGCGGGGGGGGCGGGCGG